MERLKWRIIDDGSLVAHAPNWSMHIWWNTKLDRWELDATRLVSGSQASHGACSQFLQDCIAIAEAWAAGVIRNSQANGEKKMQRLDWIIDPDGSLNASADGWNYEIIPHEDGVNEERSGWWDLTCSRNGSEEGKWFLLCHLEDAMAFATALAAGVGVKHQL